MSGNAAIMVEGALCGGQKLLIDSSIQWLLDRASTGCKAAKREVITCSNLPMQKTEDGRRSIASVLLDPSYTSYLGQSMYKSPDKCQSGIL